MTPERYGVLAKVCFSTGGTRLAITNTSAGQVLRVTTQPVSDARTDRPRTFSDLAGEEALPNGSTLPNGGLALLPDRTLYLDAGGQPLRVEFAIDEGSTPAVGLTIALASALERRFQNPSRALLERARGCAESVTETLTTPGQLTEDWINQGIKTYGCRTVVSDLFTGPEAQEEKAGLAGDEIARYGKKLLGNRVLSELAEHGTQLVAILR